MSKNMIIFGVGTGLGTSIARKFGNEGYSVALVARNRERLETLAAQLAKEGIKAQVFPADLTQSEKIPALVETIKSKMGSIDAIFYGPQPAGGFVHATQLTTEIAREKMDLYFFSLINAVNAVLPEMRKRKDGKILVSFGGSAAVGFPFFSGPGPAVSASRNYLQSLFGELAAEGVFAGMLTITALIKNSESHTAIKSGKVKFDLQVPEVDPAELAGMVWDLGQKKSSSEVTFPAAP
jgi:short-subunit dehydrogenase